MLPKPSTAHRQKRARELARIRKHVSQRACLIWLVRMERQHGDLVWWPVEEMPKGVGGQTAEALVRRGVLEAQGRVGYRTSIGGSEREYRLTAWGAEIGVRL